MSERILCAAIRRKEPRICHDPYYDNDILKIEIGYRHIDILFRFKGEVSQNPYDQGFYTSTGRYVTRGEAYDIAVAANQLIAPHQTIKGTLYSEDLY